MKLCLFRKGESKSSGPVPFLKKYTSKEIRRATDEFSMIIGSDSNGTIYRGRFPGGLVASVIKRARQVQGDDTFSVELQLLGRLHHRHLVRLEGFSEGQDSFLVFDQTENGSLKDYLRDPLRTPLNWRTRLQIAIDVAAALEYLYYFCDSSVYTVTVNSSNIMLDEEFVAKLSNVGVRATNLNHNNQHDDSEDRDNERSRDLVFQYGVLILELITGQTLDNEEETIQWVQESEFAYSMHKMVDADLGDSYDSRELKSLLIIARLCTRTGDDRFISIPQILRYLQGKLEPCARSL